MGLNPNNVFVFVKAEQARNRSGAADLQSDTAASSPTTRPPSGSCTVVNVGLAGCLPVSRVLGATGACAEDRNQLANLASGQPGLVYSLADNLGLMVDTIAHPRASGFTEW